MYHKSKENDDSEKKKERKKNTQNWQEISIKGRMNGRGTHYVGNTSFSVPLCLNTVECVHNRYTVLTPHRFANTPSPTPINPRVIPINYNVMPHTTQVKKKFTSRTIFLNDITSR